MYVCIICLMWMCMTDSWLLHCRWFSNNIRVSEFSCESCCVAAWFHHTKCCKSSPRLCEFICFSEFPMYRHYIVTTFSSYISTSFFKVGYEIGLVSLVFCHSFCVSAAILQKLLMDFIIFAGGWALMLETMNQIFGLVINWGFYSFLLTFAAMTIANDYSLQTSLGWHQQTAQCIASHPVIIVLCTKLDAECDLQVTAFLSVFCCNYVHILHHFF